MSDAIASDVFRMSSIKEGYGMYAESLSAPQHTKVKHDSQYYVYCNR